MAGDADADGDSQMRSSSDENDSDPMFPAASEPTTPQNNDILSQLRQAELSPPNSQDPPVANGTVDQKEHREDWMDFGEGLVPTEDSNDVPVDQMVWDSLPSKEINRHLPGYNWKNSRAREEFHRAMEQVVDKGFNLREFGDPFDERDNTGSG
ncbi:hypothetical protein MMC06_001550 [Schaereria dolodes]|nr:hypothetical protein [Schaereria dolodes]